ncbi:hypothetical protein Bca52824_075033 [Brassica carinata]|uniref:Uncharacterized protein n=1 Tax=Brassica carinata TaxID=52824 RepID=A0A8X7PNS0_BRACI|nr:hypothetical protein Bca52824_075033 [Brassica carinata]
MALPPVAELADYFRHRRSPLPGFKPRCQLHKKDSPVFTSPRWRWFVRQCCSSHHHHGSAQSECKLTGSTRLSTPLTIRFLGSAFSPGSCQTRTMTFHREHFAPYSDERPEAELHRLTTAPHRPVYAAPPLRA